MFNPEKILQEIIFLLKQNGGKMNVLKVMKELYLIDRESIKERDSSVSGDVYFSMKHGPVLSQTLNMLYEIPEGWAPFIEKKSAKYFHDICLKDEKDLDRLTEKDKEYIQSISDQFRDYDSFKLEEYTHSLPEWVDPEGSSRKIHFRDIMKALGRTEEEIREAKEEYEFLGMISGN